MSKTDGDPSSARRPTGLAVLPLPPAAVARLLPIAAETMGWDTGPVEEAEAGRLKIEYWTVRGQRTGAGLFLLRGSARLGTTLRMLPADEGSRATPPVCEPFVAALLLLARSSTGQGGRASASA